MEDSAMMVERIAQMDDAQIQKEQYPLLQQQ